MSRLLKIRGVFAAGLLAATCPALVFGQTVYVPTAGEYALIGSIPGDQVHPQIALKPSGGYAVWQDNVTDGDGWGVSARQLDGNFSPLFSNFRVNVQGAGDQENPQVSLLNGGGAVFVWQGGSMGFQRIYSRFLGANNTWMTGDIQVNTFTNDYQVNPVVTTLANSNIVVTWASFNEVASGSMQDVYAQLLTPAGQKIGGEILINQTTAYNQRTPAVAALGNGNFVAVWVSENQTADNHADIYARLFNASGMALGGEFIVNTSTNICANPSVVAGASGGFAVAWGEKDATSPATNSWDVYARTFSSSGTGGTVLRVNTQLYGDQYAPKISYDGNYFMIVWTSMGQDGSREGVYGQFLQPDGSFSGGEIRVNSTTISQQIQPDVASDGAGRFLSVWTSFTGGANSFDLFAQRYATTLQQLVALSAPFVTPLSSNNLSVTWPALAGFSVAGYDVYADGATTPTAVVTNIWWTMTGLPPSSKHAFQVAYDLTDGRHSPLSASTSGTTYSSFSWGGIPYDWMQQYFGSDVSKWPLASMDSDGDGVSNLNEFLAGTNPTNAASVLKVSLLPSPQGLFLVWNTQPGLVYQVQVAVSMGAWANLGTSRFAAGTNDSMYVGGNNQGFYRVLRVR